MTLTRRIAPVMLLGTVVVSGGGLAAWKSSSLRAADAEAAMQPEPVSAVTVAESRTRPHQRTTTAIGTVLALQSVTLRNELAGTVREVRLTPGEVVEVGALLVAQDVSVEEAELRALQAQSALAETMLGRMQRASESHGASAADVDRARAERDVAQANVARLAAVIARKTIRAPFRARVGLADVHPGQYLNEGTQLTTLQGVDPAVHVDFAVAQDVAAALRVGQAVEVNAIGDSRAYSAAIVALDSRVDPVTRNALVRARLEGDALPSPGSSVRVRVPVGPELDAVTVPVSALRKGPTGDHVFVVGPDEQGKSRGGRGAGGGGGVGGGGGRGGGGESGPMLGDEIVIVGGLASGEQVAAAGSFKLFDGMLVAIQDGAQAPARGAQ